jgi:hypothetical protein
VHRGAGGWHDATDESTSDRGLGFNVASLDVSSLPPGEHVEFTWQWQESGAWHGRDYQVSISSTEAVQGSETRVPHLEQDNRCC